jgi:hypothetical protein
MERCNLRKLNEMEGEEEYQIKPQTVCSFRKFG